MGPRIAIALVAGTLLVAAAAALLVPRSPLDDSPAGPAEATTGAPLHPPPPAPPASLASYAGAEEREPASSDGPDVHERVLRVVDEHARPLAGAEVRWRPVAEGTACLVSRDAVEVRVAGAPSSEGGRCDTPADRRGRTDETGAVTLVDAFETVSVEAFLGARHGSDDVPLDEAGPATLVADPSAALLLRAVDRTGTPVADVPVVLRSARDGRTPLWRGATDGDGEVVCPSAARLPPCEVVPDLPFDALEPLPLTDTDLSRGTLTLRLPPGAPLALVLETPDGAPLVGPALLWLHDADGSWTAARREDGRWRRPWFPLGRRVRLEAVPVDRRFEPATVEAIGPVRTGHATEVRLRFQRARAPSVGEDALTAILVRGDGAPAAERDVEWSLEAAGRSWRSPGRTRTDGSGRLALPYESYLPPSVGASLVFLLDDAADDPLAAAADVTGRLLPGGARLGHLELAPARVAAAGVVVEPDGRPVPGADVVLRDGRHRTLDVARTDDVGRFVLRHPKGGDDLRVQARSERHLHAPPRACRAGADGLRLVLHPAGGVAGRVLLDDRVDPGDLQLLVVQGRRQRAVELDAEGRFEAWGFAPGTCTFKARIAGEVDEVARVLRIPVRGGERTEDPRLAPIDLRGKLLPLTLTVLDERGEALRARVRVAGASLSAARLTDPRGRAVVLARTLPLRVEVSALPGLDAEGNARARTKIVDVEADRTVVLGE